MQNIEFKLRPSRVYSGLLGLVLIASTGIVLALSLNFLLKSLFLLLLAAYGANIFYRYALLRASLSIVAIRQIEGTQWQVTTHEAVVDAILRGDSTVTPVVSILRFNFPQTRWPVTAIVCPDSLALQPYRRLVGVLRMR